MSAQRESVSARGRARRSPAARQQPAAPQRKEQSGGRRLGWLGAAIVLVVGVGIGISRISLARGPALVAWDGPDAGSSTAATEIRLVDAARRAPNDASAQLDLGQFYLDDAKPFEALWALRAAERLDPKAVKPRLLMARAMETGELYDRAVSLLQETLRDHPNDPDASEQLADLQLTLGQPDAAAATLRSLAAHQPLSADQFLLFGRSLEAGGRDAEALQQYNRFQQAQPRSEPAYLHIGATLLRLGRLKEAQQAFTAAEIVNARSAEAHYSLGLIELKQGPSHEEAARQKFAEAVGTDEQFAPAHLQLGLFYMRHQQWERASNVLLRSFQLDPENTEAARQLAQARRAMGDLAGADYYEGLYYDAQDNRPKAREQYQSLAEDQADPRGSLLLSNAWIKMDHKEKGAATAREGLARHPDDLELTERLIALDLLTGNLKEAEQLCRSWQRQDPSSLQPVWLLGRVRLATHDVDGALQQYRRAAAGDPQNAEYQYAIGSAYADHPSRGNWEQAARYYGQAVTLKPDEARYRLNLGIALQNIGDLEGARRQFLRAMDLDVNQSAPLNDVVQVARGMKQFDQVEFWAPLVRDVEERLREELPGWKRVWDTPQDSGGYLPLAHFLERTGDLHKAAHILQQALALRPDMTEARRELATLQRTLNTL